MARRAEFAIVSTITMVLTGCVGVVRPTGAMGSNITAAFLAHPRLREPSPQPDVDRLVSSIMALPFVIPRTRPRLREPRELLRAALLAAPVVPRDVGNRLPLAPTSSRVCPGREGCPLPTPASARSFGHCHRPTSLRKCDHHRRHPASSAKHWQAEKCVSQRAPGGTRETWDTVRAQPLAGWCETSTSRSVPPWPPPPRCRYYGPRQGAWHRSPAGSRESGRNSRRRTP